MAPRPRPLEQRFWEKVDRRGPDECWPWTAARFGSWGGYGRVSCPDRRAHRVAWELANGPIPDGMQVLHSCDNPPCCNPAHLSVGTNAENVRQMNERGRAVAPPRLDQAGERNHAARLTQDQVHAIRQRRAAGEKQVALAHAFDVSQATVSEIVNRKHWVDT